MINITIRRVLGLGRPAGLCALAVMALGVSDAGAAGFAITAQGAAASGKSTAFTAQADDPSAIYYNPAGLSQLTVPEVSVGTTVVIPQTSYAPSGVGNSSDEEPQTFFLPQLYITNPLGPRVVAGLGVFAPFGLATDWPRDWDGRFQLTYASIKAITLAPTIAWKPTEALSLGGGIGLSYVRMEQRKALDLAALFGPLTPEGSAEVTGDGYARNFHLGALWQASEAWSVGVSYQSRIHAEFNDGKVDFTTPGFEVFFPDGGARSEIDLPPTLRLGVLVRPVSKWNVELDAVWTGWSTLDRVVVAFDSGLPTDQTNFGWKNSMTYNLGTEYRLTDYSFLRGGFSYDATPIPSDTVGPLLPDGDRRWFSLGGGYDAVGWKTDLSYNLILFDRDKANNVGASSSTTPNNTANGFYKTMAHGIALSLVKQF
ncbi:MAG: outer membrane protein transport protein [Nitrospiria bacterium]